MGLQHSRGQDPPLPFPSNVPRGPKNAQVHQTRLKQGPGAKATSHDQSNHLNQASRARAPGYHHGNHSSQCSGGRTTGYAIDTRPSQIWGGATPHRGHQQKHNLSSGGRGGAEDKRRSRHKELRTGLTIASGMRMTTASSFLHEGECYLVCFVENAVGSSLLRNHFSLSELDSARREPGNRGCWLRSSSFSCYLSVLVCTLPVLRFYLIAAP